MEEQRKKSNGWKWAAVAAILLAGLTGVLVMLFGGEGRNAEPVGTVSTTPAVTATEVTSEPERTVTMTPTQMPTLTNEPFPTPTAIPELTEEVTPTIEPTEEVTPTVEPTEEVTPTAKPTDEVKATNTPTPSPTITPTVTVTPTKAVVTNTPIPTPTSISPTNTPTPTPTNTPTPTPTNTPTPSPEPTPEAWAEPKERKDLAEMLMAKVNEYRVSQGKRKWEDPRTYYDVNNPGLYDRLFQRGITAAKRCCMEHSANHDSGQIATGIYFYPWQVTDIWKEEVVQRMFDRWHGSSAHNKNMLYDGGSEEEWVPVAVMTVVEHFDGEDWHYCAVMTVTFVPKDALPEGLE